MKKIFGVIATGAAAISLVACGSGYDYKAADLRLVSTGITSNLNSVATTVSTDVIFLNHIGEGLTRKDESDSVAMVQAGNTYTFSEGLAKSASYDNSTYTWTFVLREAKWENGDTVTASDFVYGWQRVVDPVSAAQGASFMDIIKNGEAIRGADEDQGTEHALYGQYEELGITAVNSTTLQIELTENVAYFLDYITSPAFYPVHQKTYEESLEKDGDYSTARYGKSLDYIMAVGPFYVEHWDVESGIGIKKNDNYWDEESVEIDTISWKLAKDSEAALLYYEQGNADRINITGAQYDAYVNKGVEVEVTTTTWFMPLNLNNEYIANPNVREALATLVDKPAASSTMNPYVAVDSLVPKGIGSYNGADFRTYSGLYNDTPTHDGDTAKVEAQALIDTALLELGVGSIELDFMAFGSTAWQGIIRSIHDDFNTDLDNITVNLTTATTDTAVYATYNLNSASTVQGSNVGSSTVTQIKVGTGTDWAIGWYGGTAKYSDPTTFLNSYRSTDTYNIIGLYDLSIYDESMVSSQDYKSWDVTGSGENAGQASMYYDSLLTQANAALQSNDFETYYDYLVEAEEYLIDNHFIIPVSQRAGGVLDNGRTTGVVTHSVGATYTWKWVTPAN